MSLPAKHESKNSDSSRALWESGLGSEISFWDEWLASKGGRWAAGFTRLLDHSRELEPSFKELIDAPPRSVVKLLDVGAGPITSLAVRWEGRHVVTIAVDPLAQEYERAILKNGIVPLVWTEPGEAEKLTEIFLPDEFDLVHASNCIDHTYDPMRALREMLTVTKPGRSVVLEHAQNEGVFQNYDGLHQWNFDFQGGELVLWRPDSRRSATREFAGLCSVDVRVGDMEGGRKWISARLRKNADSKPEVPLRYRLIDQLNASAKKLPLLHGLLRRAGEYIR